MYMDDEFIAQKCLRICIYRFEVLGIIQYKTNTALNNQKFLVCSPKDDDEEQDNRPIL